MTLIIAGYEHLTDDNIFGELQPSATPRNMEVRGIFVAADSAITSGAEKRTLLNGFRKVYEVEAVLWKPDFTPGNNFLGYRNIFSRQKGFIAFAGSTLTAQHILNVINVHMENLRITCVWDPERERHIYMAARDCQRNILRDEQNAIWGEDTFTDNDFIGILSGDVVSNCIEHSINVALKSAAQYKLSMEGFREMHTELISGFWCPVHNRYELYVYRMLSKRDENDALVPYTKKELVKDNQVVVLGMRRDFEERAQVIF
ncbi:hypothetical protein, partial [Paracoccus sediminilitoris]|uniref:hypothetical protein n=1 Tax=Paracoccus sediminilitoris TaxID=2202419 RepID=UPI0011B93CD5